MSQENIEVVRRVMRCFADQDVEGALADIDPHAVLDWSDSDALDSGVYTGHGGWRSFFDARDEALSERRFDSVEVLTPAADTVVVTGRVREQGRTSGVDVATYGAAVFTLRGGKIIRFKIYQAPAEASKPWDWKLRVPTSSPARARARRRGDATARSAGRRSRR